MKVLHALHLAKGLYLKQLSLESSQIESGVRKVMTFFYWAATNLTQRGPLLRKGKKWLECLFSCSLKKTPCVWVFCSLVVSLPLLCLCLCLHVSPLVIYIFDGYNTYDVENWQKKILVDDTTRISWKIQVWLIEQSELYPVPSPLTCTSISSTQIQSWEQSGLFLKGLACCLN